MGDDTSIDGGRDVDAGKPPRGDAAPGPDAAPAPDSSPRGGDWYGCFAVDDGAQTCRELCAGEDRTCTDDCNGEVWWAYSLWGPCDHSQPTRFGGSSCDETAFIGTGDTIYVQCCCR